MVGDFYHILDDNICRWILAPLKNRFLKGSLKNVSIHDTQVEKFDNIHTKSDWKQVKFRILYHDQL